MKNFLKSHAISIFAIVALIALLLPFLGYSTSFSNLFAKSKMSTIHENLVFADFIKNLKDNNHSFLAVITEIIMIACPILILITNYIKPLATHRGKIFFIVPAVCIVYSVFLIIKMNSSFDPSATVFSNIHYNPAFGFYLTIISYLGMIVAGAVKYHGYTLDKAGIEKLKEESSKVAEKAKEKAKEYIDKAE